MWVREQVDVLCKAVPQVETGSDPKYPGNATMHNVDVHPINHEKFKYCVIVDNTDCSVSSSIIEM